MALELFLRGCLIGLVFGVPAGAIGALAIQRTLAGGFWNGFLTGLGSSAADSLYACAGVFGLTVVTDFLTRYQQPIGLAGAALILLYGLWMIAQARKHGEQSMTLSGVQRGGFASAFVIAILNPATILSFMIAFSSFGIVGDYSVGEGAALVLGVLAGTGLWWMALCLIVSLARRRITPRIYLIIRYALGLLLLIFGLVMLIRNIG